MERYSLVRMAVPTTITSPTTTGMACHQKQLNKLIQGGTCNVEKICTTDLMSYKKNFAVIYYTEPRQVELRVQQFFSLFQTSIWTKSYIRNISNSILA